MLSETEINNITETQLASQLLASIKAAVVAVAAPVPARAAEPAHWIESSTDEFKRQAPGSLVRKTDGSLRYIPTKNSTRGGRRIRWNSRYACPPGGEGPNAPRC